MISQELIESWGIPECLKNLNIEFRFNDLETDLESMNPFYGGRCYCNNNGSKFFLYDLKENEPIFTMHFDFRETFTNPFSRDSREYGPLIELTSIKTASSYRKMGIASFYMKKLIELCESNNLKFLMLNVAPSERDTRNALNKEELTNFYNKFSTGRVEVVL